MGHVMFEQKRELYKAMRSAHDGICPLCTRECGDYLPDDRAHTELGSQPRYKCTHCDFQLTFDEVGIIKTWAELFHRNLSAVLKKWRANYGD